MSKGSSTRPHNKEKFDESFIRVFGRKEIKTWNPDGEEESTDRLHPKEPHREDGRDGCQESKEDGSRGSGPGIGQTCP